MLVLPRCRTPLACKTRHPRPRRAPSPSGLHWIRPPPAGARPGHRQPGDAAPLPHRAAARRGRVRPGLSRPAARALVASSPQVVCIKASQRIDGWLREAYFGQLLDGHPRAIRVFDTFPLLRPDGRCSTASPSSTRATATSRVPAPHAARAGRRPRRGARSPASSRCSASCTAARCSTATSRPLNVFVCDGRRLKLGDFGIVRQQSDRRGITARTLNALTAPERHPRRRGARSGRPATTCTRWASSWACWSRATRGCGSARDEIRRLPCSDHLKEIVYRCIGERRKRYESADELIEALRNPPARAEGRRAADAEGRAPRLHRHPEPAAPRRGRARRKRAGAIVHGGPSARTTVVVRGRPNPLQAAGRDAGLKLMEIKRLREKGHRITLLNETQFWRLAGLRRA